MKLTELSGTPEPGQPAWEPRKWSDVELTQIDKRIIPVAVEEWQIFGWDPITKEIWWTSTEVWPEWTKTPYSPEEMDDEQEFNEHSLRFLKQRRDSQYRTDWHNYKDWLIAGEVHHAKRGNIPMTTDWWEEVMKEVDLYTNEIKVLAGRPEMKQIIKKVGF